MLLKQTLASPRTASRICCGIWASHPALSKHMWCTRYSVFKAISAAFSCSLYALYVTTTRSGNAQMSRPVASPAGRPSPTGDRCDLHWIGRQSLDCDQREMTQGQCDGTLAHIGAPPEGGFQETM